MTDPTLLFQLNDYLVDGMQRTVMVADTMRQRGDNFIAHSQAGKPPILIFEHELIMDGRDFEHPTNYALLKITPLPDHPTDPKARPCVIIDPRAGHGPGIAGSKINSSIGVALAAGHPCYFVTFGPHPCKGQTIQCVLRAEIQFLKRVNELHAECDEKPFVIGNCQGGWALMLLASTSPDLVGPIMLAGAPLAYWSGKEGQNPMRYSGGLLGGAWLSSLASDLGNGHFDGANLVQNFENLNPANTLWGKQYQLYANVDTEEQRYLDFERWWGGHFLMNREEIDWIVQNLFIGNKLCRAQIPDPINGGMIDFRNIHTPIIVFASHGDNITPPPQALNWICDLYADVDDIRLREQVIVYCLHNKVGHLGIFVSAGIASREHSKLVGALELIELLPPGLYEAHIEDLYPGMPHQELIEGRHLIRFEPRTLDDIRALDDGREDEAAFEVVNAISERNQTVYNNLISPVIRSVANEPLAKLTRLMHPNRMELYGWSGLNPWTWGLSMLADSVKEFRLPVDQDNPWLAMEQTMSEQIMKQLDDWRLQRDQNAETLFKGIYETPWLRLWLGLPAHQLHPDAITRDRSLQAEIQQLRRQLACASMADGGPQEALLRSLIYLHGPNAFVDERAFHLLEHITKAQNVFVLPKPEQIRLTLRHQILIMQLNPQAALEALPLLLPEPAVRRWVWSALEEVMQLSDSLQTNPEEQKRLQQLSMLIGPLSEPAVMTPTPALTESPDIAPGAKKKRSVSQQSKVVQKTNS